MPGIRRCDSIENSNPHNITGEVWEYEGIKGDSEKPSEVGKHSGICIICAGASNVFFDLANAKDFLGHNVRYTLLAVNDIGIYLEDYYLENTTATTIDVYAICTAHPEFIVPIVNRRLTLAHNKTAETLNKPKIFSDYPGPGVDVLWSGIGNQVGSSGMLATLMAICMGFDKIILCGMPLDLTMSHFYSPYVKMHDKLSEHIIVKSWEYATTKLPTFKDKVRSMSGRTAIWCGYPDREWISK